MEVKKTRTIPEKTEEYVAAIVCDLCGNTIGKPECDGVNWTNHSYNFDKTCVKRSHGADHPEGGWSKSTEVHICPSCWNTKLMPWLEDQGVRPTETNNDW